MEYAFWLYLLTRLDSIKSSLFALSWLTFALCALSFIVHLLASSEYEKEVKDKALWLSKKVIWVFVVAEIGCVFTPSQKDAMFIAGGIGVIEAARSDVAQRIASKSVGVIERFLDEMTVKEKK